MAAPRLLPLIGVAVVGVIAINALSGARDLPRLISGARALAEGVAPSRRSATSKTAASTPGEGKLDTPIIAPASAPAAPAAGVCAAGAADLARSAGLSPGELDMLQKLQVRRGQIDQQAKDLDGQTQLLAAAEIKLDAKLKAMADLKSQIEALLGQADQKTQAEVDRLVIVMAKMKPKDAGPLMATLDDKVRVPLAAKLKEAKLAEILGNMSTADAKKLTELLARRFANVQQLADASKAAPPSTAPAAKPPAAKTAAAKTADAEAGDANVDDAPKPKKKPARLASHAPPKQKPPAKASAKKPIEQAAAPQGPKPYSEVKDQPAKPAAAAPAPAAKT
jgi:flagellar motility protein MotE (MotC chaperone)